MHTFTDILFVIYFVYVMCKYIHRHITNQELYIFFSNNSYFLYSGPLTAAKERPPMAFFENTPLKADAKADRRTLG